jgi:acyl-CoA synthetase (AMP-forming)/AMP-acid ligase II
MIMWVRSLFPSQIALPLWIGEWELIGCVVTLLSCLAAHSIALPLSPAFPANELQYILDQSQAAVLLSSAKFEVKKQEVLKQKLNEG